MNKPERITTEDLSEPLTFPAEAYISRDYAVAEAERLWSRVWQQAGRVEEIPEVGSYITYNIGHDSILIVRTAVDAIKAYHNVCPHRGRRLVGNNRGGGHGLLPQSKGEHSACGRQGSFACPYHAWTFNLDGKATHILDKEDWQGSLTDERTGLEPVQVDTWGGWIWINMDPAAGPLRQYLEPVATLLDPFEFDKMR
jgi:phenylpropionate dioxygenase-like ring-hydroxylating dioxygenase large terminal subunit